MMTNSFDLVDIFEFDKLFVWSLFAGFFLTAWLPLMSFTWWAFRHGFLTSPLLLEFKVDVLLLAVDFLCFFSLVETLLLSPFFWTLILIPLRWTKESFYMVGLDRDFFLSLWCFFGIFVFSILRLWLPSIWIWSWYYYESS
jgi:hypothetical protein